MAVLYRRTDTGGMRRIRPHVRYLKPLGGGSQRRQGLAAALLAAAIIIVAYVGSHRSGPAAVRPRPAGIAQADIRQPMRVGLQVGHRNIGNVPDELSGVKWDFGASFYGVNEVDVNQDIANRAAALLRARGITVDVLDATVPVGYSADALVAIHADGLDNDSSVSGFRVGSSFFDTGGQSAALAEEVDRAYGAATGLAFYPTISENMTRYFAFNSQKFQHSVAAGTPSILIECGFLSNDGDRSLLTQHADQAAAGIAQGVQDYLEGKSIKGLSYPTTAEETGQALP